MEEEEETAIGGDAVYKVQMRLLSLGETNGEPLGQEVTEGHLAAAAWVLSRADYADVVTERSIAGLCGFALCGEAPTCPSQNKEAARRGAKFRISLSEHRVYDLTERSKFCSDRCLLRSKAYEAGLPDRRPSTALFNNSRRRELSRLFSLAASSASSSSATATTTTTPSSSSSPNPPSLISLRPSADPPIPFDAWLGPPDAIEGYVPRSKPSSKSPNPQSPSHPQHDHISHISMMFDSIILDDTTDNNTTTTTTATKTPTQANKYLPEPHPSHLKSSLKKEPYTSAPRTQTPPSVRWADHQPTHAHDTILSSEEHAAAGSLRVASAEACAAALTRASDILSSGNSAVEDASTSTQLFSPLLSPTSPLVFIQLFIYLFIKKPSSNPLPAL